MTVSNAWAEWDHDSEFFRWINYDTKESFSVRIPTIDERFWSDCEIFLSNDLEYKKEIFAKIEKNINKIVKNYWFVWSDFLKVLDVYRSWMWQVHIQFKKLIAELDIPHAKHMAVMVMLMLWRKWYNNISFNTSPDIARSAWDAISATLTSAPNSAMSDHDIYDLKQWYYHWNTTSLTLQDISDYDPTIDKSIELDILSSESEILPEQKFRTEHIETYLQIPHMDKQRLIDAFNNLDKAISRLQANNKFSSLNYSKNDLIQNFLPLMIKESSLIPTAIQKNSKAKWYCQLLPGARKDAQKYIKNVLWVTKTYDVMDPVDNIILGIVYYKWCLPSFYSGWWKDLSIQESFVHNDVDKFAQVAYNAGAGTLRKLASLYRSENNKSELIERDSFASRLTSKVDWLNGSYSTTISSATWVMYHNWFANKKVRDNLVDPKKDQQWNKISKTDRLIHKTLSTSKLVEIIDYTEVIWALSRWDFANNGNKAP